MAMEIRPECFRAHLGAWAILPRWMEEAVGLVRAGLWRPELAYASRPSSILATEHRLDQAMADGLEVREVDIPDKDRAFLEAQSWTGLDLARGPDQTVIRLTHGDAPVEPQALAPGERPQPKPYLTHGKTAIVDILGPLQKGASKFGGTSTLRTRSALRTARDDDEVKAIVLRIESPGGHVSGTKELADDVRAIDRRKPVYAYIEDIGASAAYWIASQARRISANAMAEVGSLGTFAVIVDSSERFALEGLKVHVVSTGEHKGAFQPGTEVTDTQLKMARGLIDGLNGYFMEAVQTGRRFTDRQLAKVNDGGTWLAEEAKRLRLVDRVETFDDTIAGIEADIQARESGQGLPRRARSEAAQARLRRMDLEGGDLGVASS